MRLLFIADIMGRPGRRAVTQLLPELRARLAPDVVIANAENSAAGAGFTPKIARELMDAGADVLTGGNHSFDNKEGVAHLDDGDGRVLRPHNYPPGNPGCGRAVLALPDGRELLVINLIGRVFMNPVDCPFRAADDLLADWEGRGPVFVDMHAEASSEKIALARYLDGRVSAVIGTHTHVQTADARILPGGTAYLTDAGMTGPHGGIIGMDAEAVLHRFLRQNLRRFEVATEDPRLQGALITIDKAGRATAIERIDAPLTTPEGGTA
ncbi:MAG: TIGR00282 family metallophosphoesterase [Candidatus Krumholzibacteriia bacterium]|nr:YmdB family metallophosphoesterase [bacterium]MCB9515100.1 YmdB family metallophosphoesterase [Candidatus Latescibacterota bacterium]